jgi:hypothetical protein
MHERVNVLSPDKAFLRYVLYHNVSQHTSVYIIRLLYKIRVAVNMWYILGKKDQYWLEIQAEVITILWVVPAQCYLTWNIKNLQEIWVPVEAQTLEAKKLQFHEQHQSS